MFFGRSLRQNDIGDGGAKALSIALTKNMTLVILEYVASLPYISWGLYSCSRFDIHSLGACGIRDEGAMALGNGLKENRSLTNLK